MAHKKEPNKNCEHCGRSFYVQKGRLKKKKFCSVACYRATTTPPLNTTCEHCGKRFHALTSRIEETKFCSWACRRAAKPPNKICEYCGKPFRAVGTKRAARRCCSQECRDKSQVAENSRNWNGGRQVGQNGAVALYSHARRKNGRRCYYQEHRIVAADAIGRPLDAVERVVHINENRTDNRPENLFVFPNIGKLIKAFFAGQWPTQSNLETLKTDADRWAKYLAPAPYGTKAHKVASRMSPNVECETCGRPFNVAESRIKTARFCSKECRRPVE